MAKWIRGEVKPVLEKYDKIYCFSHGKYVGSKSTVRQNHKGCDCQYVDKDGRPVD